MILMDTHMHSSVSFDGKEPRLAMAAAAQQAGLNVICFTDHYDVINEQNQLVPHYNWQPARVQQQELQKTIPNSSQFQAFYGLELGNAPADFAGAEEALAEPGLDFVIGSIHNCSLALSGQDFYYVNYRGDRTLAMTHLEDYFASITALVQWGGYDTLGHLPYPLRYMAERDGLPITLRELRPYYWELLCQNAQQGKAVEVNTNRGRDSLENYRTLLQDWREVGGELVTVGADAHESAHVGLGIPSAYELLQDCGFRYVTYYRQRQPVPVKI